MGFVVAAANKISFVVVGRHDSLGKVMIADQELLEGTPRFQVTNTGLISCLPDLGKKWYQRLVLIRLAGSALDATTGPRPCLIIQFQFAVLLNV